MTDTTGEQSPVSEMSFEDAMRELERVVSQLEAGDVALAESIRLYERGAELKAQCDKLLRAAEEKVAQIVANEAGEATGTKPVEGL
ncbi:MAG: exodeoxyribonuclease VII small subunit [Pseudomonadota bacterium]